VLDLKQINQIGFELCQTTYESVLHERSSSSVLLYGEAGCGKTHLLNRLRRWLNGEMEHAPSVRPACVVAIRMETAPSQIWRHIRRRFAEQIVQRSGNGLSPLDGILTRFAAARGGSLRAAFDDAELEDLSTDLTNVLVNFHEGRHRRLCRGWLAGDALSESDLTLLNQSVARLDEVEEDFAEHGSRRIVLALTRLAEASPIVFFFDQVEALGIAQQGQSGYDRFLAAGAALIDGASNVLAVSTVLTTFLSALQNSSYVSNFQRMSKRQADLQPLSLKQGLELIAGRLSLVKGLAQNEHPVSTPAIEALFERMHGRCNARKLIHEARRLFTEWQELSPAAPETLDAVFEAIWARAEIRNSPETADAVLAHGLPMALDLLGTRSTAGAAGFDIQDGARRLKVVLINQPSMISLASALRKLLERQRPGETLCLLRDTRLPISKNAKACLDRLQQIEDGGGRIVRVEPEALAALDAIRRMLTDATSGDLSLNGETVAAQTVRDWLRKNLPRTIEQLASALAVTGKGTAGKVPANAEADALLEFVAMRKVVAANEVAAVTGWSMERIEDYARANPVRLRWFGGSCPVVCLAISSAASTEVAGAR
jgi:hypothetical protein